MRQAVLGGFVLALAACAAPPEAPPPPHAPPPPPPSSPAPPPAADECGASQYQHLVGRPRSEIPVPVRPDMQRVACTTCPITMDFNARRLNFFFDAQTGIIREVRCG